MMPIPPPELAAWMRARPPHPFEDGCVCARCGRVAGWLALIIGVPSLALLAFVVWALITGWSL
jgi:hypothetical protein